MPIRPNEVGAGQGNRDQCGGEKPVDVTLDMLVNRGDTLCCLVLDLIVLDEQSRDRGAQRRLTRLSRHPDLIARFLVLSRASEREHLVDGHPELLERICEKLLLSGRPAGWCVL